MLRLSCVACMKFEKFNAKYPTGDIYKRICKYETVCSNKRSSIRHYKLVYSALT